MNKIKGTTSLLLVGILSLVWLTYQDDQPSAQTHRAQKERHPLQRHTAAPNKQPAPPTPTTIPKVTTPTTSKRNFVRIEPFSPYEYTDFNAAVPLKGVRPEALFSVDFDAIKALKKDDTLLIPSIAEYDPVEVIIQESKPGVAHTKILHAILDTDSQKASDDFAYIVTGETSAMITLKNGEKTWTGYITQNGVARFYDRSKINATQRFDIPDTQTIPSQKE